MTATVTTPDGRTLAFCEWGDPGGGGSGGGPHSLVCAALLSERVTRAASVAGVAPFGPGGLAREEFFEGMVEGNVREFGWAGAREPLLADPVAGRAAAAG